MRKSKIIYNPNLTVAQNAENNQVSVSAIRWYIRVNGIDRKRDNALIIQRAIQKLNKENPNLSIAEIANCLNISINTVKKYSQSQIALSSIDSNKLSSFDLSKRKFIISSVSDSQDEILSNILRLYIPSGLYECDLTYSVGNFYLRIPQPKLKFDKYPQKERVRRLEEAYNLEDRSLNSIVIDLPFLVKGYNTHYEAKMVNRFNCFYTVEDLYSTNTEMIKLAYSKLDNKGMLIMKTMDLNYSGVQYWISDYVVNEAIKVGFRLLDKFILVAKSKVLSNFNHVQRSARKFHSYFFVFQK